MTKIKKFLQFYSLPLLSAVLIGSSYMPFPPWAVFFCYVPLWIFALRQKKMKHLLIGAWLCQFLASLIGFNWVAYTIREFGFFPWPVAVVGLLAFAGFTNLHIPIALFFWFISQKKLIKKAFSLLSLFLLPLYSALIMEYYPMIFEWNFGYTWFYARWPAAQTAQIWGVQFLHTLTLFSNLCFLCFYLSWMARWEEWKTAGLKKKDILLHLFRTKTHCRDSVKSSLSPVRAFWVLAVWVLLFAGLNFYGYFLKQNWPEPDQKARVLLVQPNIENLSTAYKRLKKDPRPLALSQLIQETEKYFNEENPPPDFILWPEGAYPYRIRHEEGKARESWVQRQAQRWQSPIVLSATGESSKGTTNSIFVFNKEGRLVKPPYNKTLLLVFGEYLPGEKWLPIKKLLPYYGRSFQRGTGEHRVTQLNGIYLGFQICYEGLFDFFSRNLSLENAQILVNVTNDSWYGSWQQPWQHLYMTMARAIEVRRPLIRGTNTGLSAFVSAKGEVSSVSPLNESVNWIQEVPYYSLEKGKQSTFTIWGYYINRCFLWFLFFFCLGYFFFRFSRRLVLPAQSLPPRRRGAGIQKSHKHSLDSGSSPE